MESTITYLAVAVLALIAGFALHVWMSRSKRIDLEAEAIKALTAGALELKKFGNEDDVIAAAQARKDAKRVALDAFKAKVAQL